MADGVAPRPGALAARLRSAPLPADPEGAARKLTDLVGGTPSVRDLLEAPAIRALMIAVADHSPFLWSLVLADPARWIRLMGCVPEAETERIVEGLSAPPGDVAALMARLRRARQEIALLVALADLGGVWDVEAVTEALTRFADAAVRRAFGFLLAEAERNGKLLAPAENDDPDAGCGLVVLALGKQGGGELNYSSDIDLVVFFDPEAPRLAPATVPSPFFVRLTQHFVRILQERTADGYVLRVDLRLRPDPASTTIAVGLPSAFAYYERLGQNWERAAFIKARPVAGDRVLGARVLADLAPFVWRKYFDYAAIADIHAMKRQIHAVRGQAAIGVPGHNVKLGRGGIREVEFFVQTQQLIFGGRRPPLRGRRTLDMLAALATDGWIGVDAVHDLGAAYRFLREIEHRLQMVADQQTQLLPADDATLARFARFAGFDDIAAFSEALTGHLGRVADHYARLFERAPGLDTTGGSLVFTGDSADPETVATVRALGFVRPEDAVEIVRGWQFGRRAAIGTPRSREVLTDLVPSLLSSFAGSADPDAALAAMDTMLGRMPAAVELLSLLRSNAALRSLFADVLGSAPRLAATIAARPHMLDAAIDPAGQQGPAGRAGVAARLERGTMGLRGEAFLDGIRDFAREEWFLIGLRLLSGALAPEAAALAYSDVADATVEAALDRCAAEFAEDHGRMPGGACVVLGMGKLGSREMTASSDLDLIVIYRFDALEGDSDGPRPLDGPRYYTRLMQRLIAALTAPTRRGRLYDVDVRLRPSGRQGPLATQFAAFVRYQADEAQTWEHMALTRARVVAGNPDLTRDVEAVVRQNLMRTREPTALKAAIRDMRDLVAREKGSAFWDMKLAAGGLLDIEFIAQFLVLRFGATRDALLLRHPSAILDAAGRLGLVSAAEADTLVEAYRLHTAVAQVSRLAVDGPFDPEKAGAGVVRRLCRAANAPDRSALRNALDEARSAVRAIFAAMLR